VTGARRSRWPLVVGLSGGFLYSNFLIAWALQGFENTDVVVSRLEVPGQPDSTLLRATDILSALLVLALLPSVPRALPRSRLRRVALRAAWVFGVGALVAAGIALPCAPGVDCSTPGDVAQTAVHNVATTLSDVAAFVSIGATWCLARRTGPHWLTRTTWWLFWIGGVVAVPVLAYAALNDHDWVLGVAQRVHIACIGVWICCLGLLASRPRPDNVLPPGSEGEMA